jgi:hypothetical protein
MKLCTLRYASLGITPLSLLRGRFRHAGAPADAVLSVDSVDSGGWITYKATWDGDAYAYRYTHTSASTLLRAILWREGRAVLETP